MLKFELLRDSGVLVVEPRDALTAEDFRAVAQTVDPFIQENGKLTGLLIDAPSFPGWESFACGELLANSWSMGVTGDQVRLGRS